MAPRLFLINCKNWIVYIVTNYIIKNMEFPIHFHFLSHIRNCKDDFWVLRKITISYCYLCWYHQLNRNWSRFDKKFLVKIQKSGKKNKISEKSWTNLLCHKLRVNSRFTRGGSFPNVTHEALECFSVISISTDAAVPIIVFQNLGLTFTATRMVHCSSEWRHTAPKLSHKRVRLHVRPLSLMKKICYSVVRCKQDI